MSRHPSRAWHMSPESITKHGAAIPGLNDDTRRRSSAEAGSERLRIMLDRLFDRLSRAHGISFEDARLLIVNSEAI